MGTIWELFAKLIALINQTDCWCGVETRKGEKEQFFHWNFEHISRQEDRKQEAEGSCIRRVFSVQYLLSPDADSGRVKWQKYLEGK